MLYAVKNINALEILKDYSPEGGPKTAQAELPGKLEEISQKYLADLETKLNSLIK